MKESTIVSKMNKRLKEMGARPVKIVASAGQEAGVSDIIVCYRGIYVAIEVKCPDYHHKLSALQCLFLDDVEAAGGCAAVCDSVEQVEELITTTPSTPWRDRADERAFPGRDRNKWKANQ